MDKNMTAGNDITATLEPVPATLPATHGKFWKILVAVLGIIGVSAYVIFRQFVQPFMIVGKAVVKTSEYESAKLTFQSASKDFTFTANMAGTDKLSTIESKILHMGSNKDRDLAIEGVVGNDTIYLRAAYSHPEEFTTFVKMIDPNLLRTQTYTMLKPLVSGQAWLHIAIPESADEKKDDTPADWNALMSDRAGRKFAINWLLAVKPVKVDRSYTMDGETYTYVSFGFRKERLISALDSIKDMEVDVKVSQINSLIKIIESSDDWDRDLVAVMIDRNGDVRRADFKLPVIDENVLNDSIARSVDEKENNPLIGSAATSLTKLIWNEQEGGLTEIGTMTIGSFNDVAAAEVPKPLIEGTALMYAAQVELGPLVGQMISGSAAARTVPPDQRIPGRFPTTR